MTDVDEEFTSYLAVAFPRLRRTAFLLCGDSQTGSTALVGCTGSQKIGKLLLIDVATGRAIKTIRLHGLAVSVAAAP